MDAELQRLVWQHANQRCEYCHFPADISLLPFQIDHVISEKHGGATTPQNLALSCERCNSHKGPNIAGYLAGNHVPLFNPRTDRWADHFEWNGPLLVGKTPVGSVTIDVLAINLPYRVTLRAALFEEGIFPLDDE
jgi:hypothetical protein